MSAWRIFVREVADAGPVAMPNRQDEAAIAIRMGLVERCGKDQNATLYRVTEAGRLFAQGKIAAAERPSTGRTGRPGMGLTATWLRALPDGVVMDRRPPRAAVSEWGGL